MSCHSRVHNPYRIRDEDSGTAGNSSGDHRFDRCELSGCVRATDCCPFEESTGPLIPCINTLSADTTESGKRAREKCYSSNRQN